MTKCYTFYSYKGGSGRSTTAMNTVQHLISELGASPERPILVVDADLESAGLTFFFGLNKRISNIAVSTTQLLSGGNDVECRKAFGYGNDAKKLALLPGDVTSLVKKLDELTSSSNYEYLSDVEVTPTEKKLLKAILQAAVDYESISADPLGIERESAEKLINLFPPSRLFAKLQELSQSDVSGEQRRLAQRKVIKEFLPEYTFSDLSEFYQCEPGTVRFLGVDVNSDETKVQMNSSASLYDPEEIGNGPSLLVKVCKEMGCAAVVFDCGAGTQSSAHALHSVSDVIVYCMRPTMQFALGTQTNLYKYRSVLEESCEDKPCGQKPVIVLPTAVPKNAANNPLCAESFKKLHSIVGNDDLSVLIDSYFCSPDRALGEVDLFKWREMILGTPLREKDCQGLSKEAREVLAKYEKYNPSMPNDARQAYQTYKELAKRLRANSDI